MPILHNRRVCAIWISDVEDQHYAEEPFQLEINSHMTPFLLLTTTICIVGKCSAPFKLCIGYDGFHHGVQIVTTNGLQDCVGFKLQPNLMYWYSEDPAFQRKPFWELSLPEWKFASIEGMPVWLVPQMADGTLDRPGQVVIFEFDICQ